MLRFQVSVPIFHPVKEEPLTGIPLCCEREKKGGTGDGQTCERVKRKHILNESD